ncbi:MAG: cytochrome c biogenesis protein CcdA [Sumerlaeia bacterium]
MTALFCCIFVGAEAQFGSVVTQGSKYPAKVEVYFSSPLINGEPVELVVWATIDAGYYTYGMNALVDENAFGPFSTTLGLDDSPLVELIEGEEWQEQQPKQKMDSAFGTEVRYHDGKVEFRRTVRALQTLELPLSAGLSGFIQMQICDDSICLPPRKSAFTATHLASRAGIPESPKETEDNGAVELQLNPESAGEAALDDSAATQAPGNFVAFEPVARKPVVMQSEAEKLQTAGVIKVAGLAFLAGLVSLITPCVFPMIPITISFFTKQAAKTTAERILLVGVYSGSIVLGFAVIGFGLAFLLYLFGFGPESAGLINAFAANPVVNILLASFFILFALSLFGLFEFELPSSWANALQKKKGKRKDWLGAMLMAFIFVIISFTCTAPIVGPLVVLTIQGGGGNIMLPAVGLTAYAVGFALPFMILGLVPSAVSTLPKSGSWLHASKITFGLLELGIALVYFGKADLVLQWGFFSRELILAAWVALSLITMLYLLGLVKTPGDVHGAPEKVGLVGPGRLSVAVIFGTLAMYFSFGLFGGRISPDLESLLPRTRGGFSSAGATTSTTASGHDLPFIENDLELALQQAKAENKPIFLDFTGWTCTNCWRNALDVFPRPEVKPLLEEYVRVALYTDDATYGEKWQQYQTERFSTFSLPFYAVLSPDNEVIATYGGLIRENNRAEFVEFLELGIN